jgi:hypothetical protein
MRMTRATAESPDTRRDTVMESTAGGRSVRTRTIGELYELIAALDRRVPQVHRAGEASIAHAAAALRSQAVQRIADLEREAAAHVPV